MKTVQAGSGFDDMQPLKKLIGNARIVCLGEATHGTREFFQLKHRMLEFLVTEMGFTIFGIEATMPEGFDVNEYVLTGSGDPEKALAGLYFWTWDTEEVLDMIRWMRQYNAVPAHTKKVKFYGFDMQFAPRAARVTREYLHRVEPDQDVRTDSLLSVLADPVLVDSYSQLPLGRKHEFMGAIDSIRGLLNERKQRYIGRSSLREWQLTCQHANVLAQYLEAFIIPGESGAVRDSSMAQNIRWISDFEGRDSKMVVWAHNGHVGAFSGGGVDGMGVHLRRMFGSEMFVFGFAFNEGRFQAMDADSGGLHPFTVGGAPGGSLDSTLAAAGLSIAAIDLRSLPKEGPVARYFGGPLQTRSIGAVFSDRSASNFFALQEIPRLYDAVLFVESTTSARPLERGKRPAARTLPEPSNLDFEKLTPAGQPVDWTIPPGISSFDFQVLSSDRSPHSGKYSAMIRRGPGPHYGETSASLSQQVDAKRYRGRRISVSAAVRMESTASNAGTHLWLRIVTNGKGPMGQGFHMNRDDITIRSNPWQVYHVSGDVGEDADLITYGISFVGDGTVWVDDVHVEAETAR
ncbi:MAG TPA: erythromycin esterase family protein [Bacteroidota bacterium]|nr:erythromycin esterase family protein [Bacteroidota bacterium]